nr:MAG TPA: hypothetical protein [Caudoviricetes sp.]
MKGRGNSPLFIQLRLAVCGKETSPLKINEIRRKYYGKYKDCY